MKIAVPTLGNNGLNEKISDHFGRCPTYTILDKDGNVLKIIANTSSHNGGHGLPPELLQQNDVNILLCRGIGPKAIEMCKSFGITVFVDLSDIVQNIFNKWKNNYLKQASFDDACKEHHK